MLHRHLASFFLILLLCAVGAAACAVTGNADFDPPDGVSADAVSGKSPDGGTLSASQSSLPCNVEAILKTNCGNCHGTEPKFGASLPLVTQADLMKMGSGSQSTKRVYELVRERLHDDVKPMPPRPNPRLDPNSMAVFDAWVQAGAKASTEVCNATPPTFGANKLACTADTVFKASKPWTLQANSPLDQTVCFGASVTFAQKRHVTALSPVIDKGPLVRNILLFQAGTPVPTEPFPCSEAGSSSWQLVAGWAPGGQNLELPPQAGLPQPAGASHWVVQVRYGPTGTETVTDQSGYGLCTTEALRPYDAGLLAFGSSNFTIPAHSTLTVSCDYRLEPRFRDVTFLSAAPHMQSLGQSISMERLVGGGGTPEMLYTQNPFRSEAQTNATIAKTVAPNDIIRTTCSWKNMTDAQVGFGDATGSETCLSFVAYYPKIKEGPVGKTRLPDLPWNDPLRRSACTAK